MESTPLHTLTEDDLIRRLSAQLATPTDTVGIGDDCAVIGQGTLFKTDNLIQGRHYLPETPPELVGHKAIARVISDFAAMGGSPQYFLVTCGLTPDLSVEYVEAVYRGMNAISQQFSCYIIGGETSSISSEPYFSISGIGTTSHPILRSGAQIGDLIFVTGSLGNSFHSQHHLHFTPRVAEALWLQEHARPSAMMDLSDGLARDLPRIAQLSKVGYTLDLDALPLRAGADTKTALTDGEDYELLFTISPELAHLLDKATYTQIGTITTDTPHSLEGGWDHLCQS